VTTAIEAGGNGVRASDLRLSVGDPAAALDRARDAAVQDASGRAERYAAATDQALGDVLSLRELTGDRPSQRRDWGYALQRTAVDELADLPIRAGKEDLVIKVEIVWAFAGSAE
jgi:uncharacterized protein YggE